MNETRAETREKLKAHSAPIQEYETVLERLHLHFQGLLFLPLPTGEEQRLVNMLMSTIEGAIRKQNWKVLQELPNLISCSERTRFPYQ
jgi:hypothetical protein